MEVSPSIQQTTFEQFQKAIEESKNKAEIAKIIEEILENQSVNTFSEYLNMKEIDEVRKLKSLKRMMLFDSSFSLKSVITKSSTTL